MKYLTLTLFIAVISCKDVNVNKLHPYVLGALSESLARQQSVSFNHLKYNPIQLPDSVPTKDLQSAWIQFYNSYKQVQYEYRNIPAVRRYLVYNNVRKSNTTQWYYTPKNPSATAFAFLIASGIDLNAIDNPIYLNNGRKILSLDSLEFAMGLEWLLTHERKDIINTGLNNIEKAAKKSKTKVEFLDNALFPLLTVFSTGMEVPERVHRAVLDKAGALYSPRASTVLTTQIYSLMAYQRGGVHSNEYLVEFNEMIANENRHIAMDNNYCGLFHTAPLYTIGHSALTSIQLLKELPFSRPKSALGDANYQERTVNLYENAMADEINEILGVLARSQSGTNHSATVSTWSGLPLDSAQKVVKEIYESDFVTTDTAVLKTHMYYRVALHEAKHAWDTQFDKEDQLRRSFDAEVSAHLTDILFSNIPLYASLRFMDRITPYANDEELKYPVEYLCTSLWKMVNYKLDTKCSDIEFSQYIYDLYENYRDQYDKQLPDLEPFKRNVVEKM